MKTLFKFTSVLLAVGLVSWWIYFSGDFASLALDYLLRRAGENEEYPALGSNAFYIACGAALFSTSIKVLIVLSIPLGLVLVMLKKSFQIWSSSLLWIIAYGVVFLPLAIFGAIEIRNHMKKVAEHASNRL